MPTIPAYKTLTNNSVDVLNAIRNSATTNYRDYVPVAHDGSDIMTIGNIIMDSPALQNTFINTLVNRIGLVIMSNREYYNKWSMFKKGMLEYGEVIEEIFVDLARPFQYDIAKSETTVLKREMPVVRTAFHVLNFKTFYKVSIQRHQLKQAFIAEKGVLDLVTKIIDSMYSGAEYDEFLVMKYMLAKNALNGRVTPVAIPSVEPTNMKNIVSTIKGVSNAMEFMTTEYNTAGVRNYTLKENQYIILNAKFDAVMDVEVLASAFNMDKADFMGHRVLVDGFDRLDNARLAQIFEGNDEYEPITDEELALLKDVPAMIVDKDYFVIMDNLKEVTDLFNSEGLYWSYWLHVWKVFSVSPFMNNAMFVEGEPSVASVTIAPSEVTAPAGSQVSFKVGVETLNFAPKTVVYETDNEKATVSASGVVTLADDIASGTVVNVTATSTEDELQVASATITVA